MGVSSRDETRSTCEVIGDEYGRIEIHAIYDGHGREHTFAVDRNRTTWYLHHVMLSKGFIHTDSRMFLYKGENDVLSIPQSHDIQIRDYAYNGCYIIFIHSAKSAVLLANHLHRKLKKNIYTLHNFLAYQ